MTAKTLITFHSFYGSTEEIARWIAERIGGEVRPIQEVTDVSPYGLVIVGSPIYADRPLKPVRTWVEEHKEVLSTKALVLYAVALDTNDLFMDGRRLGPVQSLMPLIETMNGKVMLAQGLPGELNPNKLTPKHMDELGRYSGMMGIGPYEERVPFNSHMDKGIVWSFAERVMRCFEQRRCSEEMGQANPEA